VIAADFDFGERRQLRVVDLRPVQSRGRGGGRYEREFDLTAFDVLPVNDFGVSDRDGGKLFDLIHI